MCLPNNNNNNNNNNNQQNKPSNGKASKARSPWGRIKQQLRPRLTRKIVPSSKINLNNFWADFQSAEANSLPLVDLHDHSNEIHDNIINELLEL